MNRLKILVTSLSILVAFSVRAQEESTKRITFLVEHSIGLNDKNTKLDFNSYTGASAEGVYLFGSQLITLGSRIRLTKNNTFLQASISTGLGQNGFDQITRSYGPDKVERNYEQYFEVITEEISTELMISKQVLQSKFVQLELGAGAYYRDYTFIYYTGPNTSIVAETGIVLGPNKFRTYTNQTFGSLVNGTIILKSPRYKTNLSFRYVGLFGERYVRTSFRTGLIFTL